MGLLWQLQQFRKAFPEQGSWAERFIMWKFNRTKKKKAEKTPVTLRITEVKAVPGGLEIKGVYSGEIDEQLRREIIDGFNETIRQGFLLGHAADPIFPRDPDAERPSTLTWEDIKPRLYPTKPHPVQWTKPDRELTQLFWDLDHGGDIFGDLIPGETSSKWRDLRTGNIIEPFDKGSSS